MRKALAVIAAIALVGLVGASIQAQAQAGERFGLGHAAMLQKRAP